MTATRSPRWPASGAALTVERQLLLTVDDGPLPRVDVEALGEFLRMVLREMR